MTFPFGQVVISVVTAIVVLWLLVRLGHAVTRTFRQWRTRRFLRLHHGGRPAPLFALYPELDEETPPRPPIKSLRKRGDHDAA